MSKVENFETKLYSDQDGWKIWLCTERTAWEKVISFFKVQYPVKGTPSRDTNILQVAKYYDTVNSVKQAIEQGGYWIQVSVGTTYSQDEYSDKFMSIMNDLIKEGLLEKLKEHNRKTLHSSHLLPGYRIDGTDRVYTVYHDVEAGIIVNARFIDKPEGGYKLDVTAIMDINGRACKAHHVYDESMHRPESISNAVFKVLNTLLDESKMDKEDRMDIVSDITHYFNVGRFGFWHLLYLLNKNS